MTEQAMLSGSRLQKLLVRRTTDGYLNVIAIADSRAFLLHRNGVTVQKNAEPPQEFHNWLIESHRGALVEELWTDEDSLFVLLDHDRCIVYEFALSNVTGVSETILFLQGSADMDRVRRHLAEDPDVHQLETPTTI